MAKVLIPLAQGCEELEAVTIIDLLRRAGIDVVVAGLDGQPVTASRGVRLLPDLPLDEALMQDYDMLVLPGGLPGADHLDNDARIRELLVKLADAGRFVAAICAAPKVLIHSGVLDGKRATGYPGIVDREATAAVTVDLDQRVIRDGRVITSRGPGTAMDFALELIEALTDAATREQVERGLVR